MGNLNVYLEREANKKELVDSLENNIITEEKACIYAEAMNLNEEELVEIGLADRFRRWQATRAEKTAGKTATKYGAKAAGTEADITSLMQDPVIKDAYAKLQNAQAALQKDKNDQNALAVVKSMTALLKKRGLPLKMFAKLGTATEKVGTAEAQRAAAQFEQSRYNILDTIQQTMKNRDIKDMATMVGKLNQALQPYRLIVKALPKT